MVDEIAAAVLYEGYLLYPYRASALKNQHRFNFGVVAPRGERQADDDGWFIETECLVRAAGSCELDLHVRFLQLTVRTVEVPTSNAATGGWQEAIERDVALREQLDNLCASPVRRSFDWPAAREIEPLPGDDRSAGCIARSCESLHGCVEVKAGRIEEGLFKITVRVSNVADAPHTDRSHAAAELRRSLVSTHAILHVPGGEFISLTDPPDDVQTIAAACRQVGVWPVLVGEEGDRDAMLASPIILYDHPQIAPESAGDFFDGTEIDEMLVLRILTMTDEREGEMRDGDPRARRCSSGPRRSRMSI